MPRASRIAVRASSSQLITLGVCALAVAKPKRKAGRGDVPQGPPPPSFARPLEVSESNLKDLLAKKAVASRTAHERRSSLEGYFRSYEEEMGDEEAATEALAQKYAEQQEWAELDDVQREEALLEQAEAEEKRLDDQIVAVASGLALEKLAKALEIAGSQSSIKRQEAVARLRERAAWASAGMLGAVVSLVAAGAVPAVHDNLVAHTLGWATLAVAVAASNNLVLAIVHAIMEYLGAFAGRKPSLTRWAGAATKATQLVAYLPSLLVILELFAMGAGGWNLTLLLEACVKSNIAP